MHYVLVSVHVTIYIYRWKCPCSTFFWYIYYHANKGTREYIPFLSVQLSYSPPKSQQLFYYMDISIKISLLKLVLHQLKQTSQWHWWLGDDIQNQFLTPYLCDVHWAINSYMHKWHCSRVRWNGTLREKLTWN